MTTSKWQSPKKPKKRSLLKLLKRLLGILICCVLGVLIGWRIFLAVYYPDDMALPDTPTVLDETLVVTTKGKSLSNSFMTLRDGIYMMRLQGDPFELGYCNALLTDDLFQQQEQSLYDTIKQYVPSQSTVWLLHKYIAIRNRNLPRYIRPEYQMEIRGIAMGYRDYFPQFGPLYYRLLSYHAAHDISHAVMDNPLVGCTAFAAWSSTTRNGNLIVGRNFDFTAGECFDKNKIVMFVQPTEGLRFISVAWPGMIGVVSGINEARIAVTLNAAQSVSRQSIGTPVSLVIREVLQFCSTLDQAVTRIQNSHVFVANSYLIADGKTGRAVIVEKTPASSAVVVPTEDYLICSNHFQSRELKDDSANTEYMWQGTSVQRYNRMKQLLDESHGRLDIKMAATILRDRTVESISNTFGNPRAINPLIATHSVIMDVTEGVIWVSQYPHQIGRYVPFSVHAFDQLPEQPAIDADPLLDSEGYVNYQKAVQLQHKAKKTRDNAKAIVLLKKAESLNPADYVLAMMLGQLNYDTGQFDTARQYLLKAKNLFPAYETERQTIEELIRRIDEHSSDAQ